MYYFQKQTGVTFNAVFASPSFCYRYLFSDIFTYFIALLLRVRISSFYTGFHCHGRLLLNKHKLLLLTTLTQSIPSFFTLLLLCENYYYDTSFLYEFTKYLTHYLYINI